MYIYLVTRDAGGVIVSLYPPTPTLCPLSSLFRHRCAQPLRFLQVQNTYRALLSLYHKCLDNLRPGVPAKDVVDLAHRYLREKSSGLEQYLTKVVDWPREGCCFFL